ncbi:MAG: tetratricopeptide repeat protein [Holophagales bacterium]|nr:tetratricopeptide repeat protein [Holophagales bacterium]
MGFAVGAVSLGTGDPVHAIPGADPPPVGGSSADAPEAPVGVPESSRRPLDRGDPADPTGAVGREGAETAAASDQTRASREAELRVDPLTTTPEMRAFADGKVGRDTPRHVRLAMLRDAIFDPERGLGITYGSSATHTAAATFEARSGNCLSFTLLFVSLARHLGLQAYFVEVDEVTGWSQRGGVSLAHWHMFAEVELDNGLMQVDFLPWAERRYRLRQRIGEDRARAHYFNNMGVEILTGGDTAGAVAFFERALELDPAFAPASVNLAAAQRRAGRPRVAEKLLLGVLAAEPDNVQAASNLASLYLTLGEPAKAGTWIETRHELRQKNPFYHFRLGLEALAAEQAAEARDHLRRAITLQGDEAIFHEKLAEAFALLGETRRMRRSLSRALQLTEDPEKRREIEARLRAF